MKSTHALGTTFAAILAFAAQSAAASSELVGLWSDSSCTEVEDLEYQGRTLAVYAVDDAAYIQPQFFTEIEPGLYLSVTEEDGSDTYPLFITRDGDALVQYWLKEELASEQAGRDFFAMATADGFNSAAQLETMEEIRFQQCSGLPFEFGIAFGEAFSLLKSLDEAVFQCRADLTSCPKRMFDMADVTGDGALSVAEMARLFRAATLLGSAADDSTQKPNVAAVAAVSTSIAPIAAAGFLHSFDYDRSGDLSFEELLFERLPTDYQSGSSMGLSAQDFIDMISGAAESATGLGSMIMR